MRAQHQQVGKSARAWPWWLVSGLTIGMGSLLVHQWLVGQPLWLDEQMLALNIRERGFADLLRPLWLDQSAPPGWLMLERLAYLLLGDSEQALRALPMVFGVATLGLAAVVGHRWLHPLGAASLVMLCGLGTWLVYHALELKPYSADAFWGLALPALAAWTVATPGRSAHPGPAPSWRRLTWWVVAAGALWLSLGALLVAPACMIVLVAHTWRQDGWPGLRRLAPGLAVWVVSAGAAYWLALGPAAGNATLQSYWAFAFPPASGTLDEDAGWWLGQFVSVGAKPGGTMFPLLLWATAVAGLIALARRTAALGSILLLVPVSMCVLAWLRLVPMYERLTLWILPALYVGIASSLDAGVAAARQARTRSDLRHGLLAVVLIASSLVVMIDIARLGLIDRRGRLASPSVNHELDDRGAMAWIDTVREPGDAVITTRLALPAVWWYGRAPVSPPELGRSMADGTPVFQAYSASGRDCHPEAIDAILRHHPRVIVYLGFRFDDVPDHFDDLLLDRASRFGRIVAYRGFGSFGGAAVVDLRLPPLPAETAGPLRPGGIPRVELPRLGGCIGIRPAERW